MPSALWNEPIYRFRVPEDPDNPASKLKEIVFDVTLSAPSRGDPSGNLSDILNEIFAGGGYKRINTVLEFGAAKMKNIPFIFGKGKEVWAVDFEKLLSSPQTQDNVKLCDKWKEKFHSMMFPNPFISDTTKFDLALLANVVPVMPVFAERLFLMQLLHDKVNKYILWIAQKEGSASVKTSYRAIREAGKNACGDGIWMGSNRRLKSFYRHHAPEDVDEMMGLYGFRRIKKFPGQDDAMLYEKIGHAFFKDIITSEKIRRFIPVDHTIKNPVAASPKIVNRSSKVRPVVPDPKELSIETLLKEKIKNIRPGAADAEIYHRVTSWALARVFRGALTNINFKVPIGGGIQVTDTIFKNVADKGFFKHIPSNIPCTYVRVEAKNISSDPDGSHFIELNGYLDDTSGRFGILVCRRVRNVDAVLKHANVLRKSVV